MLADLPNRQSFDFSHAANAMPLAGVNVFGQKKGSYSLQQARDRWRTMRFGLPQPHRARPSKTPCSRRADNGARGPREDGTGRRAKAGIG